MRRVFAPGAPKGVDEESSAVIPMDEILGRGWYLLTQQAHSDPTVTDPELVEGGQLLAMKVPGAPRDKGKHEEHEKENGHR